MHRLENASKCGVRIRQNHDTLHTILYDGNSQDKIDLCTESLSVSQTPLRRYPSPDWTYHKPFSQPQSKTPDTFLHRTFCILTFRNHEPEHYTARRIQVWSAIISLCVISVQCLFENVVRGFKIETIDDRLCSFFIALFLKQLQNYKSRSQNLIEILYWSTIYT